MDVHPGYYTTNDTTVLVQAYFESRYVDLDDETVRELMQLLDAESQKQANNRVVYVAGVGLQRNGTTAEFLDLSRHYSRSHAGTLETFEMAGFIRGGGDSEFIVAERHAAIFYTEAVSTEARYMRRYEDTLPDAGGAYTLGRRLGYSDTRIATDVAAEYDRMIDVPPAEAGDES